MEYLAFRDGPRSFRQDFSCPAVLRISLGLPLLRIRGSHPVSHTFPCISSVKFLAFADCPITPRYFLVWASSLSLATTQEIILIFFSYRYLDVSVPCVLPPMHYVFMHGYYLVDSGFPHSDISGSCVCLPLAAAFRRLLRPSSPHCA